MTITRGLEIPHIKGSRYARRVRVCYPSGTGTLILRTNLDWERDIHPVAVSGDGNTATFVREEQLFLRTTNAPVDRAMWGSSLGGVISFYRVWQFPDVFGAAACMSSAFSYKDDLIERVLSEPKRDVGFYLDSGWPNDNYEVTVEMALALVSRGWRYGHDLIHLCFPNAAHDKKAWGVRLHLPMQFFTGAVARASRSRERMMGAMPA